jgi:uncharacterized protein YkwD
VNRPLTFLAALMAFAGASCTHEVALPAVAPDAPADRTLSRENFDGKLMSAFIFAETNRVRLANGASAVTRNDALDGAAEEQASSMALEGDAKHDNPFPKEHNVAERVATQGIEGGHVGENVSMLPLLRGPDGKFLPCTYAQFAARIVDAWMNSPEHRANMLDPHFTQMGCAARMAHGPIAAHVHVYSCQVFYLARPGQGVIPGSWPP